MYKCLRFAFADTQSSKLRAVAVVAVLALVSSSPFAGVGLSYLGSTAWSRPVDVVVDNGYAYVAMRSGLQVFDLSDPSKPTPISQVYLQGGDALDIAKNGDVVGITGWAGQILIINVSNPHSPFVVREYWTPPSPVAWAPEMALGIDIQDSLVAVGWGSDKGTYGITVYNLNRAPSDPGVTTAFDAAAVRVKFHQGFLVVSSMTMLWSWRVLPDSLSLLDSLSTGYSAGDMLLRGGDSLLYIADRDLMWPASRSAFSIVSMSESGHLHLVGQKWFFGLSLGVAVSASTAYVSSGCRGVHLFDVSDPTMPDSIGTLDFNYSAGRMSQDGGLLAALEGVSYAEVDLTCPGREPWGPYYPPVTMPVYDVTQPTLPKLVGSYEVPGEVSRQAVSGTNVYTFNWGGVSPMVQVIDASDPTDPQILTSFNTLGIPGEGLIADTLLYMVTSSALEIASIADPTHPCLIGYGEYVNPAIGLALRFPYLFLANVYSGLTVWDVTDPKNPTQVAQLFTPGPAAGIVTQGDYAYIAMGVVESGTQVAVVRITDPLNPVLLTTVGSDFYQDLAVDGDRLLASGWHGLSLFSLADPANPVELCHNPVGSVYEITIHKDLAFTAHGNGVRIIDLSRTDSLVVIDSFPTPGWTTGLDISEGKLYLADTYSMTILEGGEYTDVGDAGPETLPRDFALYQNYPNPFNPATTITYELPRRSFVAIAVYNIAGQRVRTIVSQVQSAGRHEVEFTGDGLASGVYLYQLVIDGVPQGAKKMLLLK